MREVGGACLLTSVTTFVGFMSLMAIPAPSTRHLALAASIGVAGALLLAITLVPIAFSFLPPLPVDRDARMLQVSNGLMQIDCRRLPPLSMKYSWTDHRHLRSAAGRWIRQLDVDARRHRLRATFQTEPSAAQQHGVLQRKTLRLNQHRSVCQYSRQAACSTRNACGRSPSLKKQVEQIPEVTAVHSISMLFRLSDQILKFRTEDGLPKNSEMAESCVDVYRDIDQERLASMLTDDAQQTRISIQLNVTGFLAITDVAHQVDEIAQQAFPDSIEVETSGSYPIIGQVVRKMVRSQMLGLATCFLSISVIMALGLRSVKNAMLAQFPNMLPAALILGFLAITSERRRCRHARAPHRGSGVGRGRYHSLPASIPDRIGQIERPHRRHSTRRLHSPARRFCRPP